MSNASMKHTAAVIGLVAFAAFGVAMGSAQAQDRLVTKDDFLRQLAGEQPQQPGAAAVGVKLRGPAGVRAVAKEKEPAAEQKPSQGAVPPVAAPEPATQAVAPEVSVPQASAPPPAPLEQAVQNTGQPPVSALPAQEAMPQVTVTVPAQEAKRPEPVKEISVSINFKSGSTQLADKFSHKQLQQIAEAFDLPALKTARIEVGGHTDGVGSEEYNRALSLRRAKAVRDEICRKNRASCSRFTVAGYGLSQPLASNDDEEGRAINRRVVFKRLD